MIKILTKQAVIGNDKKHYYKTSYYNNLFLQQ